MARPPECNKIRICRTVGEIEFVKNQLSESGKGDIRSYLRSEIKKLVDNYRECPDCVTPAFGSKIQLDYIMKDLSQYQVLQEISFVLQKSVSAIVDDFFIAPILSPKRNAK